MSKVVWAVAGALVASALIMNPNEDSFRKEVDKQVKKKTGFLGGKLAKFATYVMQESEILRYHNLYVCSVVTDQSQPRQPVVVAVGAFGQWFFGESLSS